jgi:hypothetical protein
VNEKASQPIVIYPDRRKLLRANGTTLLLGGMLAILAFVPWRRTSIVARIFALLSRMLLLAWGWFCIPSLLWLLHPKPVVIVNDDGISYHPPRMGPFATGGSLAWEEIQALYISNLTMDRKSGRTSIQRFLCVLPKDADAFLERDTIMNKIILALLMMQVGSPFVVPESMLPLPIDVLLARIRTNYADAIHEHEIELREEYKGSITASKKKINETA